MTLPQGIEPVQTLHHRPIAEEMSFEILVNENNHVWVFHDKPIPGRVAWLEYDPVSGRLEFIPHESGCGILYAEVPASLRTKIRAARQASLYLVDGDRMVGFQKVPVNTRKQQ